MKYLALALLSIMSFNSASAQDTKNCKSAFYHPYQKAKLISQSTSRHNLFGYLREWNTYRYSNGVRFFRLKAEGDTIEAVWSRSKSPYNRALEVLTEYYGRTKQKTQQDFFIFFEQGSKELFKAYEDFIQRPLKEIEFLESMNKDNIATPVEVHKREHSYSLTVRSKRKKVVPHHIRKHKLNIYFTGDMILVKVTDLYKQGPAKESYLTLVDAHTNLQSFNQLVQVLYVFNGFKELPNKPMEYLKTHNFEIAKTHPLFYIQQILKKQNSLIYRTYQKARSYF